MQNQTYQGFFLDVPLFRRSVRFLLLQYTIDEFSDVACHDAVRDGESPLKPAQPFGAWASRPLPVPIGWVPFLVPFYSLLCCLLAASNLELEGGAISSQLL